MWINMLEAGQAHSKKTTILNMIEWMGASEWYDAELLQAEKAPSLTNRGRPRKRVAIIVLDRYLKEACDATPIAGSENLSSSNNEDHPVSQDSPGIQKEILVTRRKTLTRILHRGRILRQLVQMTHMGILLSPDIWNYAKASKGKVNETAAYFQEDPQKMKLLSILDEQVELLVNEGRPDLSRFFHSLNSHSILLSEEVSSLRMKYGLETEPVPQGCLETAIKRVTNRIGQILDKDDLNDEDCVSINGTTELSCGIFDRLCSEEWLNCWDIAAALEMTDRPTFVRLGLSIPLHKTDKTGEITPISNPLRGWREKIDDDKHEVKNNLEPPQINEQTKMIYHYDSMASHGIVQRKTKTSLVRRTVEAEFKDFGFKYLDASTPQQKDGWSCGLMVIRNAKRRIMELPVGTWDSKVDPDRVIKEVLDDFQTFLDSGAIQPGRLSQKRKLADLQGSNAEPSRHSKRLKKLKGDSDIP